MREIKFRAWDKKVKRMISWDEICNGVFTFNDLKFDFIKLLQFTGLKDKNDQEIFEGDIIRYIYSDGSGCHDYQVCIGEEEVYVTDCNEYNIDARIIGVYLKDLKYSFGDYNLPYEVDYKHTEIIGNISENPELIDANVKGAEQK